MKKLKNSKVNPLIVFILIFLICLKVAVGGSSELALRIHKNKKVDLASIDSGIDYAIFDDFLRVMKKVNLFIWCSKLQIQDILNWWLKVPNITFEVLVWCKLNPTPQTNNVWLPDVEYCLYFREKGVKLNKGYDYKSKWYVSGINQKDKAIYNHPSIKPFELVKRHLLHTTQKGDLILDPFIGSGTTAEASKVIGRDYIGFENDEAWYQVTIDRLDGVTAKEREAGIIQQILFDYKEV
jgi:DNA modification methylase